MQKIKAKRKKIKNKKVKNKKIKNKKKLVLSKKIKRVNKIVKYSESMIIMESFFEIVLPIIILQSLRFHQYFTIIITFLVIFP